MKNYKLRIIKCLIAFLCVTSPLLSFAQSTADSTSIQKTLNNMARRWNHCDIRTFMQIYENSPNTMYVTNKGIVKGYSAIRATLSAKYPNCAAMGKVSLKILSDYFLSPTYTLVVGRWSLVRGPKGQEKNLGGIFSLVLKKGKDGWHIVVDHTC